MKVAVGAAALAATLFAPRLAVAQQPAGPPPPSTGRGHAGPEVHELLPDIGRIGAQVGALGGASWNPYGLGRGIQAAGYIDLPLFRFAGGKVSYEVLMAFSQARSAPFGVAAQQRTRMRLLQVSPFGLKYTLRKLDHVRLRPYAATGLDFAIVFTREEDARTHRPFDVTALGIPSGNGNIEVGVHGEAGLEVRIARGLSLNFEYRYTTIGSSDQLQALGAGLGFHF
jgi:opacity protein-like surface antigen